MIGRGRKESICTWGRADSVYPEYSKKVAEANYKALAQSRGIFMTTFLKLVKLLFSHGQQRQSKYNIFKNVFGMAACLLVMKFDI